MCRPSNISVDTILEKLPKNLPKNLLLIIGSPARKLESNLSHFLDLLCKRGETGQISNEIYSDIDKTIKDIKKNKVI